MNHFPEASIIPSSLFIRGWFWRFMGMIPPKYIREQTENWWQLKKARK